MSGLHAPYVPFTKIVSKQSKSGCSLWWPVAMILWKTVINKSACEPVNTGMSIGTVAVYGLFNRTPKLRSPDNNSNIKTPMCMRPTRAAKKNYCNTLPLIKFTQRKNWKIDAYIDRRANHLNGIKLVPKHLKHRCFWVRSTKISYCNHKFSRKKPATLDDSAAVSSNSVDSFGRADCLTGA